MQTLKVSVIVPIYDQKDLVIKALKSIPNREDVEVIAVCNGCDEEMVRMLFNYFMSGTHMNHKLLTFDEPLGCWGAMNKGVDVAKGDYIYQLDEDDVLDTNAFNFVIDSCLGNDLVYVNLQINSGEVWHINELNARGLTDHTSLIKRSFLGKDRFTDTGVGCIDGGYWLLQRLLDRKPTKTFTDVCVYYYNYPREHSLFYDATHKE